MHTERTWILIADAERARILLFHGLRQPPSTLDGMNFHNEMPSRARELEVFCDGGDFAQRQRIRFEKLNRHREEVVDFARFLADTLRDGWARKSFQHVVIAAPPAFLRYLRDEMPGQLASSISAEIPRDLTGVPIAELPRYLAGALNANAV